MIQGGNPLRRRWTLAVKDLELPNPALRATQINNHMSLYFLARHITFWPSYLLTRHSGNQSKHHKTTFILRRFFFARATMRTCSERCFSLKFLVCHCLRISCMTSSNWRSVAMKQSIHSQYFIPAEHFPNKRQYTWIDSNEMTWPLSEASSGFPPWCRLLNL